MEIKVIALLFCTLPFAGCTEPPQQKAPPVAVATVAPVQATPKVPKRTKTAATNKPPPIVITTSGGDGAGGGWGG